MDFEGDVKDYASPNYSKLDLTKRPTVFLDTCILDSDWYQYGGHWLSTFKHYCDMKVIRFALSEIVVNEAQRHLREKCESGIREFRNSIFGKHATNQILKTFAGHPSFSCLFDKNVYAAEIALKNFEEYLSDTKCIQVACKGVEIEKVVDAYFTCRPPFAASEAKKNEFPDAIMVESIKRHAEENQNEQIVLISSDELVLEAYAHGENTFSFGSIKSFVSKTSSQIAREGILFFNTYLTDNEKEVTDQVIEKLSQRDVFGHPDLDFDYKELLSFEVEDCVLCDRFYEYSQEDGTSYVYVEFECTMALEYEEFVNDYDPGRGDKWSESRYGYPVEVLEERIVIVGTEFEFTKEAGSFVLNYISIPSPIPFSEGHLLSRSTNEDDVIDDTPDDPLDFIARSR